MAKIRRRSYPPERARDGAEYGKRPQSRHHYANSKEAGVRPQREYRPKRAA